MPKEANTAVFWEGQSFEIQTKDKKIYFTQFIAEDEMLHINRPADKNNMFMPLGDSVPVTVFYFDIDEQGLFTFDTNIYIQKDGRFYLNKPTPDQIEKAQRRRFFRVKIGVPMDLHLTANAQAEVAGNKIELYTHNISGGGLAFLHPKKIVDTGETVSGKLHLKTPTFQAEVPFEANVISIVKTDRDVFRVAIEFKQMKEPDRADIIKFCMFKQVELRNKLKNDRM